MPSSELMLSNGWRNMSEEKGPYHLLNQQDQPNDAPADDGVPFWKRPAITQTRWMRVQALGLDLCSVVLATQKDTHIRAAAAELRRQLKGE